ncbi:MAG: transposase, partial [bacterium]
RYILGVRMRRQNEVSEKILRHRGAWQEIQPERTRAKDPQPLKLKDLEIGTRRYVVCLNEEQRRKDAHDREAIVEALKKQLKSGDKSLVGNKGYRKFLAQEGEGRFTIDEAKIKEDARFDGKWVLRTNTDYDAEIVARAYKSLLTVESLIRTTKSILVTRPIYHKCDETIRGHVFCSFLAILLKTELESRMSQMDLASEWGEVIRGLNALQEVKAVFNGHHFLLRSQLTGDSHKAIRAAGVAVPPTIKEL